MPTPDSAHNQPTATPHARATTRGTSSRGASARGAGATSPRPALLALVLFLISIVTPAHAQRVDVAAELRATEAYVGDDTLFIVDVLTDGPAPIAPPTVNWPEGLTGRYIRDSRSESRSLTWVNGQAQETLVVRTVYQYAISPTRAGEIIIPPVDVVVEGTAYPTNPVRVLVKEPERLDGFALTLTPSTQRVYLGQPASLTVTFALTQRPPRLAIDIPDLLTHFDARILDGGGSQNHRNRIDFILLGNQVAAIARASQDTTDAASWLLPVTITLIPKAPGTFTFPNARALFVAQAPSGQSVLAAATAEPVTIEVVPPPSAGQPANYSGLVGTFTLDAQTPATDVNVGDPIELTLRIQGQEPMVNVDTGPNLALQPALASRFKLSPEGWRPDAAMRPGERVFRTTLRATDDTVDQIPPIELPYFNPTTEAYELAQTAAIPLRVRPTQRVTLADAQRAASTTTTQPAAATTPPPTATIAPPLGPGPLGPIAPAPVAAVLAPPAAGLVRTLFGTWLAPGTLIGLLVPPAFALTVLALRQRRAHRDTPAGRRTHALRLARRLATRDPAAAVRALVAAHLAGSPAAITAADVRRLAGQPAAPQVGPLDPALAERLAAILARDEAAALRQPSPPADAPAIRDTARVIRAAARALARAQQPTDDQRSPHRGAAAIASILAVIASTVAVRPAAADEQPPATAAEELAQQAASAYDEAVTLWTTDRPRALARLDASRAAYRQLASDPARRTAALYHNLGAAALLASDAGEAVLSFRRAQSLAPHDRAIDFGLRSARALVSPTVGDASATPADRVRAVIRWWASRVEPGVWLAIAATASGLGWLTVVAHMTGPNVARARRRWPALSLLAMVVGMGTFAAHDHLQDAERRTVVIMRPSPALRGPDPAVYPPALDADLPAGIEARVLARDGKWLRVQLLTGTEAYVAASDVEPVWPDSNTF